MAARSSLRPPTPRQIQCFDTYAEIGDAVLAARRLGISVQQLRHNVGEHNRRLGAISSLQAAWIRWGPKESR